MAEKWCPVIDCTLCKECGSCIQKCTHGTFEKISVPDIVYPFGCVD